MQKTATALITYLVAACALLAIAFGPQAVSDVHEAITIADSRATPAQQETSTPATVETTQSTANELTDALCPVGLVAYDTEDPTVGDQGVICTLPYAEV